MSACSSASSVSRSLVMAIANGLPPTSMRRSTCMVVVSMTDTRPETQSVTHSLAPLGVSARPMGSPPTSTSASSAACADEMLTIRLTVPEARLATKARAPSGWMTTAWGSLAGSVRLVGVRAMRVSWPKVTLKNETEPSSVLTMATMPSSRVMSTAVERLARGRMGPGGGGGSASQAQEALHTWPAAQPLLGPAPGHTGASGWQVGRAWQVQSVPHS
jgi:hypothetical protein